MLVDIMSSEEENGYQLQNNQVNLKEMKEGVGLTFYIELNPTEQVNCERMEIDVEGSKYFSSHNRPIYSTLHFQQKCSTYLDCNL